MNETKPISKTNASFPEYLGFDSFRTQGIAHCQDLGSDLWTDFNLHDPGLTILEVLCYALTDLGYRTNLPIADLLARSPAQKTLATDDNFFTPEQILTCNPVTVLDLRKLLIDVPGVKNAWIERADEAEVKIYLEAKTPALQYEVPEGLAGEDAKIAAATVIPDGLYTVCLELDDEEVADACGVSAVPVARILDDVWTLLHRHRNLCEDFLDIVILGDEDIALCADIELESTASVDDVLLAMHKALGAFLSPELTFYSLSQMLALGKSIEEIYAGRPLAPLSALSDSGPGFSHGFIDTAQLKDIEPRTQLHVSDLYQVIMDVPGVLAVRKLLAVNYVNGLPQTRGEKWCLHLTRKHRLRFDLDRSQIQFFKGLLTVSADAGSVAQRLREERKARTKALLEPYQLDSSVPEGTWRSELADYQPLVHEFPQVYGIGEGGLPESAGAERRAQARQLRAYLLFYDQILANYLAQLANLRELFSMRPDDEREVNRTYFTQTLSAIPEIDDLLRNYNQCLSEDGYPPVPENYPDYLNYLAESRETYYLRRNQFLDHLLARFAESFTDYVLLMFDVNGGGNNDEQIVRDKARFLSTYPQTSRNRGKAFDYTDSEVWSADNVSGLEKRVSRLLGLRGLDCEPAAGVLQRLNSEQPGRSLSYTRVVEVDGGWIWQVHLPGISGAAPTTMTSRRRHSDKAAAKAELERFRQRSREERSYRRLAYSDFRHFGFAVLEPADPSAGDASRSVLAEHDRLYPPSSETDLEVSREEALGKMVAYFAAAGADEPPPSLPAPEVSVQQRGGGIFHFSVEAIPEGLASGYFTSVTGYPSAALAREAATEVFLKQAARESEYQRFSRDGFEHHGFAVLSEEEDVLAETDQPWSSTQTRDLGLYRLMQLAIGGDIQCEYEQETECFFYKLQNGDRTVVLFEGVDGFTDEQSARSAFEEEFLPAASGEENYQDIDGERYGFELHSPEGSLVLASHPGSYATAEERRLRKLAILYYLTQPEIRTRIEGEPGEFAFDIRDVDGNVLLESALVYSSHGGAVRGYRLVLERAQHVSNYRPLNDLGGELPYGFELVGHDDEVIALHPERYETPVTRDLANFSLVRLFCPIDGVGHMIREDEGRYSFALLAEDGSDLLVSAQSYPSEETARDAVVLMLRAASLYDQYVLLNDDGAYGFVLHDFDGHPLAIHSATYALAAERELALKGIINYVNPASVTYSVEGDPGRFTYRLLDPDGSELLLGIQIFPDHHAASVALAEFLELAANEAMYRRLKKAGEPTFELTRRGETLATHPQTYSTTDERDAAIETILAYLGRAHIKHRIDNPTAAYRFELHDSSGRVLLSGERIYPGTALAEAGCREAMSLARNRSRYRYTEDGPGGCPFGFLVLDEDGLVIASHPLHYTSAGERDLAARDVYAFVQEAGTLPDAIGAEYEYRFEVADHEGTAVLEGVELYPSQDDAVAEFDNALALSKDPDNYELTASPMGYSFQIKSNDAVLARHPSQYPTSAERDTSVEATLFTARSNAAPFAVVQGVDGRYSFEYRDSSGTEATLRATQSAGTRAAALDLLLGSYTRASDPAAYVTEDNEGDFGFHLVSDIQATIAVHPARYSSAADRDVALDQWVATLTSEELEPRLIPVPKRYFYQLVDLGGAVLLRSLATWDSAAQAEQAYRQEFVPFAADAWNYVGGYDNDLCTYTFTLWRRSGQSLAAAVARHPGTFSLPRLRDEQKQHAINLASKVTRVHRIHGSACGFFFRLLAHGSELVAESHYPDPASTAAACTRLLSNMSAPEAYVIEDEGDEMSRLVVSTEDGVDRALSEPGEEEAIATLRDTLIDLASAQLDLPHTVSQSKSEFRCRLSDAGGATLLESAQGYSSELLAHMIGFGTGLARDAAMRRTQRFFAEIEEPVERIEDVDGARIEDVDGDFYFAFDTGEDLVLRSRWAFQASAHGGGEPAEDAARRAAEAAAIALIPLAKEMKNYRSAGGEPSEFRFEVVDQSRSDENRTLACDACDAFVERVLAVDGFRLVTASQTCAHGFELVSSERRILAKSLVLFEDSEQRDRRIQSIRCLVDVEGFHLVEHLLLRPRDSGMHAAYVFALPDPVGDAALIRATSIYPDSAAAALALKWILDAIIDDRYILEPVSFDQSFSFYVVGEDHEMVAAPELDFCVEADRDAAMSFILTHVAEQFADPALRTETALAAYVQDLRAGSDCPGDALIPLGSGCRDATGKLCPVMNDPYGFRVTVVVPYWPSRFRHSDFRPFFERTLRMETPAHIFPRICWVDVCQMQEFEDAYRRWLRAMAHPIHNCDRPAALAALIDILFRLRSVYSTARLFGCTTEGVENPVRLDQTILGTAGTGHGDTS